MGSRSEQGGNPAWKWVGPALVLTALAACAGAGGGGGSGGGSSGASQATTTAALPPPAPQGSSAQSFETQEFHDSRGLSQIGAQYAYAAGGTGQDVTVAVIDSGVNFAHPDLAAAQHPDSINIRTGQPIDDLNGHGTAVAGVIAAARNDSGSHGVAYRSRILGIRADNCDGNAGCTPIFEDSDLADAVNYAIDKGARVVNLSLGGAGGVSANLQQALERAATEGVMIFAAAGNGGGNTAVYPAAAATDPRNGGTLIAVGAVDSANERTSFSNACGAARDYCFFAPGSRVMTTAADGSSFQLFSGTSASAPYAAGAAAALISAFPHLSASEAVQILLETASDAGVIGVDSVYGHGVLNLHAAFDPQGPLAVPLSGSSSGVTLTLTSVSLGSSFGDALAHGGSPLAQSIALDKYGRAYAVDLSERIATAARPIEIEPYLAPDRDRTVDLPLGDVSFALAVTDPDAFEAGLDIATFGHLDRKEDARPELRGLSFQGSPVDGSALHLAHNLSAGESLAPDPGRARAGGLFLNGEESLAPHFGLVGRGDSAGLDQALWEGGSLSLGFFQGDDHGGSDPATIYQSGLVHSFDGGLTLGSSLALVAEDESFLGSRSDGAFGDDRHARSTFVTLSVSLALTDKLELIGSYTEARSDLRGGGDSVFSDWSTVRANAFAAGLVSHGVLSEGDRLGLMASQPLRVYQARADITLGQSTNADGSVNYSQERSDVTPSGREINLQLAYDRGVAPGVGLQGWVLGRLQPGHDRDAASDLAFGLRLSSSF